MSTYLFFKSQNCIYFFKLFIERRVTLKNNGSKKSSNTENGCGEKFSKINIVDIKIKYIHKTNTHIEVKGLRPQ